MVKEISVYYADDGLNMAAVFLDLKTEEYYIEYKNTSGTVFFVEHFPSKSIHFVEDAAENWVLGIKELGQVF